MCHFSQSKYHGKIILQLYLGVNNDLQICMRHLIYATVSGLESQDEQDRGSETEEL